MHPTHPIAPIAFSFVLRFWLERREIEGAIPVWRGAIELVPSGERQYFEGVNQLLGILARYLVNNDIAENKKNST